MTKQPVDTDTIFEAASMSKPVFAYAVDEAVREGGVTRPRHPARPLRAPRPVLRTTRGVEAGLRCVTCSRTPPGFQNWRSNADPLTIHFTPGTQ